MTTITSPVEGFNGKTTFGPLEVEFKDGKAKVDDLPDGVRDYMLRTGYKVGKTQVEKPAEPEPADPRDHGPETVGTPLRDAAVDPEPGDFLAPTNAGKANPHGPDVVSPGIHANQGVRPVKGGDVHVDDTDTQDAEETEHAEQATDGTPVVAVEAPARNASRNAWAEYARTQGAPETELAQDGTGLGRDELRDTYGPKA